MRQLTTIAMTSMSVSLLRHQILSAYADRDSILKGKDLIDYEIICYLPPPQNGKKIKSYYFNAFELNIYTSFTRAGNLFKPQLIGKFRAHSYLASLCTYVSPPYQTKIKNTDINTDTHSYIYIYIYIHYATKMKFIIR